jgi:hypothetical protein
MVRRIEVADRQVSMSGCRSTTRSTIDDGTLGFGCEQAAICSARNAFHLAGSPFVGPKVAGAQQDTI